MNYEQNIRTAIMRLFIKSHLNRATQSFCFDSLLATLSICFR